MLTLIASPIGNLSDITFRAVEALRNADAVYCEDTRHSLILLNHFGIRKTLVSCHEHNERSRAEEVTERVRRGENIAYLSDAGMPGISDPGAVLVSACIEQGLPYTVIPGASAVLTAVVLSGLPGSTFSFFGFLPRDRKPRRETMDRICRCGHLAILFESPHRVGTTLKEFSERIPDCPAALLRELTKRYESVERGTVRELAERYLQNEPKGECVIAICCPDQAGETITEEAAEAMIRDLLAEGCSAKDAASQVSLKTGIRKNTLYAKAMEIRNTQE
ncbi:MAG: 16S rRNA (cytidine(1402)-2'-O)-methyltransferase [Clostridia bacterium]|nr:16S rRNA (cytidine(1402)-2'-O)-methyltransferase [Clostridia bacterium]MBR0444232.1 16S rRNA (cytidine(1402)-2'-O)-methyltransferase [Clostridia bacterium]